MYIPKLDSVTDRTVLLDAMRASSFAILFGGGLSATHLPLVVKNEGVHGVLEGHFAAANPHWAALAGKETLVVFPGPHTYITPALYETAVAVPTWNYVAIHAYGTLELIEDEPGKLAILAELIEAVEPAFIERWRTMPDNFRHSMLAGIVAFRIPIARIEGKFKLGKSRPEIDRNNLRTALAAGSADQQELARWMERLAL